MLLVEVPREAHAGPPYPQHLEHPMSALGKLNFTDYSNKLNTTKFDDSDRLNYEQALARLSYEHSPVGSTGKLSYGEQTRISYDHVVDSMCPDQTYTLAAGMIIVLFFSIYFIIMIFIVCSLCILAPAAAVFLLSIFNNPFKTIQNLFVKYLPALFRNTYLYL